MHRTAVRSSTLALVAGLLPLAAVDAPATAPTPAPAPAATPATEPGAGRPTVGGIVDHALRTMRWGAYGELHYNNFQGTSDDGDDSRVPNDMIEMHRLVLLAEAQLAPGWRFVSEIEIEHGFVQGSGSGDGQGEVEVEQAFIDWQYHTNHSVRGGVLLVPISIGNLYHEPTLFHGVERPLFDQRIVPTTWYEAGGAVVGRVIEGLDYQVAVQAGLDGTQFRASDAIRRGRQRGFKSKADDMMVTGRLDWKPAVVPGLWLAGAANWGESGQNTVNDTSVLLYVLEARYAGNGFELGASWAHGDIEGATAATQTEAFEGYQVFAAYDVLRHLVDTDQQLFVFARYEDTDTQAETPAGVTAAAANAITSVQYGITWKPIPWVAIKADYQDLDNDSDVPSVDSWNVGIGFAF